MAINDEDVFRKWAQLRDSAKSRGIEFSLSFCSVKNILNAKRCHYTGIEFDTGEFRRTVDRIDPSKGYVKGNVVACSAYFNFIKSKFEHASKPQIKRTLKAMNKAMTKILASN